MKGRCATSVTDRMRHRCGATEVPVGPYGRPRPRSGEAGVVEQIRPSVAEGLLDPTLVPVRHLVGATAQLLEVPGAVALDELVGVVDRQDDRIFLGRVLAVLDGAQAQQVEVPRCASAVLAQFDAGAIM